MFFKSTDIGIDLGTAAVLIYNRGQGIVLNEPSVVAIRKATGEVVAIGEDAKKMIGKAPPTIKVIRPLRCGVISDYDATEQMLKYFIKKAIGNKLVKPRIAVCVPSGVTEVERKAVEDATRQAGARKVEIIEEPVAAAIGANIDISKPCGNMIVDIGGGTSDVAVISLGGEVIKQSIKIAGDNFDEAIVKFIRKKYNILIGEPTAEVIKIQIGGARDRPQPVSMEVRGRSVVDGLPKAIEITSTEVVESTKEVVEMIVEAVYSVLELTPPELAADISDKGMVLTGGGSLLYGLGDAIFDRVGITATVAPDTLNCVAIGTGLFIEYNHNMRKRKRIW
ncbi:MAG: rod shape-determining protein [Epulopiscium sp. Nele67-Bin004]|nr:MAG: rod shape-determining protein [Epulopiscium sp. Nele67-Bin004]